MDFVAVFTILVIAGIVVALALEVFPASIILAGALLLFLFSGIISPADALVGLSNRGMVTIALLFIVAAGIQQTGALRLVAALFFERRSHGGIRSSLIRMMVPVSFFSAFLNNTPIVVMFTPIIKRWVDRVNLPPSKFLIPLSYATIFGGMCTLIGTSSNLVVHGMMVQNNLGEITMFELGKVGVPCAIMGWIYLTFFGYKLLPERRDIFDTVTEHRKEYVIGMKVIHGCQVIGKTIKDAGLRNLKKLYLMEIEREGETFGPVTPNEILREGDILYFVGVSSGITDIAEIHGLVPAAHKVVERDFLQSSSHFVEAVVSDSSPIIGKTVKESDFRNKYKAGVIAIHRNGERIKEKVGDIKLRVGDVLLLLARNEFLRDWSNSSDFYLVSKIGFRERKSTGKAYLAVAIVALMVSVVSFREVLPTIGGHKISMFYAAAAAAALMILTKCLKVDQARNSLKLNVLLTIACALGISKALQNSGAASAIASFMINMVKGIGPFGILIAIYLLTMVFSEIITHCAAAALVFPIAFSAALQLGINPKPLFIAIAIAASASFASPIGKPANLIVQGAGGYKFTDYLKVGLPLNILFLIIAALIIPIFWHF